MLRMFINSIVTVEGYIETIAQFEIDLQDIRNRGICAFDPARTDNPGATYEIGVSNIYNPAEGHKLDYDAIISRPSICRVLLAYMRGGLYEAQLASPGNVSVITACVDGRTSTFPTFLRHGFWTLKHVAMISSVDEVKESEVFLVNFDLLPEPERQIYMVGWSAS